MTRRHKSRVVNRIEDVTRLARQLADARIEAATVEYAELVMDPDSVDFDEIKARIAQAKARGFPPLPKWRGSDWHEGKSRSIRQVTVEQAPEARGNFKW